MGIPFNGQRGGDVGKVSISSMVGCTTKISAISGAGHGQPARRAVNAAKSLLVEGAGKGQERPKFVLSSRLSQSLSERWDLGEPRDVSLSAAVAEVAPADNGQAVVGNRLSKLECNA